LVMWNSWSPAVNEGGRSVS